MLANAGVHCTVSRARFVCKAGKILLNEACLEVLSRVLGDDLYRDAEKKGVPVGHLKVRTSQP